MALSLGKLTIIVGAGLVGSVLSQEGRASKVSDFLSGAFKIVFKGIQQDDSRPSSKPQNDSLLVMVNNLRKELQSLELNRSVTIVNNRSGTTSIGVPVVIVVGGVVGYGYIWWKGWKLSDMMFATRRSLSDACVSVGKQLEQVSSSISAAKRHLASRIDRVDHNLDQCAEINVATRDEVLQLRGDLKEFSVDVESVQRAVQTLETKIGRIEGKQDITNQGVYQLVEFVAMIEERRKVESIEALPSSSSRQALELPRASSTLRTISSPPGLLALEQPLPSSSKETPKRLRPMQPTGLASGLKELHEISSDIKGTSSGASSAALVADESSNSASSSSSSRFGRWNLSGLTVPFLSRTHSASSSFK